MSNLNQQLLSLGSVEKTLIIPLWARAEETHNGGLIDDTLSVEFINKLDTSIFNFEQMSSFIRNYLLTAIANRTLLIDKFLQDAITNESVVLNFGCGLDTRFARYLDKVKMWYDIDMPQVIELKCNLVSEKDNYKLLPSSIFDSNLFSNIKAEGKVVAICEGLLMYFKEDEVRKFLQKLFETIKSGDVILETLGNWAKFKVNPVIKGIGERSRYIWTINKPETLKVRNSLNAIQTASIFDINKDRWGAYGKLMNIGFLNDRVSDKITHYKFLCP